MNEKDIQRINELYHKFKAGTITEEEKIERDKLRKAYIQSFRENLRGQLNHISIEEADGSVTNLGVKFGGEKPNEDKS